MNLLNIHQEKLSFCGQGKDYSQTLLSCLAFMESSLVIVCIQGYHILTGMGDSQGISPSYPPHKMYCLLHKPLWTSLLHVEEGHLWFDRIVQPI